MKKSFLFLAASFLWLGVLTDLITAAAINPRKIFQNLQVSKRQASTNNSYAPYTAACPATPVRSALSGVRAEESDYIRRHLIATQSAWRDWLSSPQGPHLDASGGIAGGVSNYTSNIDHLPRVAISIGGGGLRALFNSLGYLQGLDSRNSTAVARGTGGFLQLASYIGGISGGSWTVGTLAINDWPTVQSLQDNTFNISTGLLASSIPGISYADYFTSFRNDLAAKQAAGYPISFIDAWGRSLSGQFVNQAERRSSNTLQWSDVIDRPSFTSAAYPFPLFGMTQVVNGTIPAYGQGTIWESNPFETGSWDKDVASFVQTSAFGSRLQNGTATSCVSGFDNFGFMIGLSSALFNSFPDLRLVLALLGQGAQTLASIFASLGDTFYGTLPSIPNPFRDLSSAPLISSLVNVSLVDGGEGGHTIPIVPLLQPARQVDMILAIDSYGGTPSGWPDGANLYSAYLRLSNFSAQFGQLPMPKIPSNNTFVNKGLNTRPTFFGCDSKTDVINAGSSNNTKAPIIVYAPDYPWVFASNFSLITVQLPKNVSSKTVENGFASATLGGITSGSDIDWPTCLACASLQRSFERSGTPIPSRCQTCMSKYCWKSTDVNDTATSIIPPNIGPPRFVLDNIKTGGSNGGQASHIPHMQSSLFVLLAITCFVLLQ